MSRQPVRGAMSWRTSSSAAALHRTSAPPRSESLSWCSQSGSVHDREIHPIKGILQLRPSNTEIRSSPSAFRAPSVGFLNPTSIIRNATSSFRRPPSSYRAPPKHSDLRTAALQRQFCIRSNIKPDSYQTSLCQITPSSQIGLINTLHFHQTNNNKASDNAK
ncbi:hypothetical protein BVRB_027150 [Beta vulgaris subsp. vulgaris]|uniref:Uncharacterized protein n=1 Tax=Beta vulgaris subsp. vulgaris TaxID=3555 RepID=A0A0J8DSX9_BETVV|nr:hypothetical protein BVRB_027150 [Beta vulgaris subsp. vulgaris]